jgi:hypothetical protein
VRSARTFTVGSRVLQRLALGLLFLASALSGVDAHAEPAVAALEVSTRPALELASEAGGGRVYSVRAGDTVELVAVATLADGSSEDVTGPSTVTSLSPTVVQVVGRSLHFRAVSKYAAAAVLVEHGGRSQLLAFDVAP